jgi:hypothetical protein
MEKGMVFGNLNIMINTCKICYDCIVELKNTIQMAMKSKMHLVIWLFIIQSNHKF